MKFNLQNSNLKLNLRYLSRILFCREAGKDEVMSYVEMRPSSASTSHIFLTQLKKYTRSGRQPFFSSLIFANKIINVPGGQINDPSLRKRRSLSFLPATPLSQSLTLEGLFELTWHLSTALLFNTHVASGTTEKQGHRQG